MFKKFLSLIIILFLFTITCVTTHGQDKKIVTFLLPVSEGLGTEGFTRMMTKLAESVGQVTGYGVNYEQYKYKIGSNADDIVYEKLKKGEAQLSYVNAEEYVANTKKWDEIFMPVFTLMFNNKVYNEYCLYVSKDSGIKTVADAKGKIWGGVTTTSTRLILHDNGYDVPLSDFFSEVKYVTDSPVTMAIEAQQKGEIDVFTAVRSYIMMGGGVPKAGSSGSDGKDTITYRELKCTEGNYGWIFGFHKSVDKQAMIDITKALLKAHKDKEFSEFKVLFMAIKGNFERFRPEDLERTREIVRLGKELGWKKEELEHWKKGN